MCSTFINHPYHSQCFLLVPTIPLCVPLSSTILITASSPLFPASSSHHLRISFHGIHFVLLPRHVHLSVDKVVIIFIFTSEEMLEKESLHQNQEMNNTPTGPEKDKSWFIQNILATDMEYHNK